MQKGALELIDFIGCFGGSKSTGKPCDGASQGSRSGEGGMQLPLGMRAAGHGRRTALGNSLAPLGGSTGQSSLRRPPRVSE
jgi:hypothetical protein